jgi:archaemetzincin
MVWFFKRLLMVVLCLQLLSCNNDHQSKTGTLHTVRIHPFEGFSPVLADSLATSLSVIFDNVVVDSVQPLPLSAFQKVRNRYRADTLIQSLAGLSGKGTAVIGLTHHDISTTKPPHQDWGVMGLGYQPGPSCVVSTYRLKRKSHANLYKLALHELGHNSGLPHCEDDHCYMRDANGGYPLDELTGFCSSCREDLQHQGWNVK